MKMRKCKICGWWFEPRHGLQVYCDDECAYENHRELARKHFQKKVAMTKSSAVLKVDPSKLPVPKLPPTKEVRIGEVVSDSEIDSMVGYFYVNPDTEKKGDFSDEENAAILRMVGEGKTYVAIALELNRPAPNAIKKQYMKLRETS